MQVTVVASGPAAESAAAAVGDWDATVTVVEADTGDVDDAVLADADAGVVVGPVGDERFRTANRMLDRWIAVEFGGIGGRAFSDTAGSVAAFDRESGCYDCLRRRVTAATAESEQTTAGGVADESSGGNETREGASEGRGDAGDALERSERRYAGALAGRRTVRLLSGESLGGTAVELDGRERRFTRAPGCDCHERPTGFERDYRAVSLDAAVGRMERLVDDRVGPITEVGERESFPLPYYVARTADTTAFSDVRCGQFGGGAAVDWNEAYAKSVGEALERYCAGVYRTGTLRHAPTEGVLDAVPVERFVRPDDAPAVAGERLAWVDGVSLADGSYAALPAAFVGFPPPRELAPPITTGLGAGSSVDEALLSGLCEVIERDATMLAWYSTFEPMEVVVETDRFDALCKRARAEGLSVTPTLCTQDVDVPVVGCAVHREGAWPQFAAGSAAALDAREAAADALAEALQNWTELRGMGPERAAREGGAIGRYADFPAEARAFVDTDTRLPADGIGERLPPDRAVDAVVERLTDAGLTPYAARLTTSDAADVGFEVVRVLVPEAQPLFTGEPYFGDRLGEVPPQMGFEPRPDRAYHPYP
ncbi:MAG: YcaO-like family protein [Halobaculum sp.]